MQITFRRHTDRKPGKNARLEPRRRPSRVAAALYLLNEGSGLTVTDIAKRRNGAGTSLTWTQSARGRGVSLSSGGSIALGSNILTGTGSFSVEIMFYYPGDPGGYRHFLSGAGPGGSGYYFTLDKESGTGRFYFGVLGASSAYAFSSSSMPAGYYHLTGTYNASTGAVTLYTRNLTTGVLIVGSATLSGARGTSTGIGIYAGITNGTPETFSGFNAIIQKIAIYSDALTQAEAASLAREPYADIQPGGYPTTVPWYAAAPPSAPATLTATGSGANINLSWSASSSTSGYLVYRSATSGSGYTLLASPGNVTTYTDPAGAGQTYYYVVKAVNSGGASGYSPEAAGYTCPTAPGTLTVTALGSGSVSLSWSAATGGGTKTYNIYDGTSPGAEGGVAVATGITGTTQAVTGLTNGQPYSFFVTAQNAAGEGAHSNETTATPSVAASPGANRRPTGGFF